MKRAATLVILSRGDGEGPHKYSSGAVSLTLVFHEWLGRCRKSLRTLCEVLRSAQDDEPLVVRWLLEPRVRE
jgi:hypothetical protein